MSDRWEERARGLLQHPMFGIGADPPLNCVEHLADSYRKVAEEAVERFVTEDSGLSKALYEMRQEGQREGWRRCGERCAEDPTVTDERVSSRSRCLQIAANYEEPSE